MNKEGRAIYVKRRYRCTFSNLCHMYIRMFIIYITFETPILNLASAISPSILPLIRYGVEGLGYILLVFGMVSRKNGNKARITYFDILIAITIIIGIVSSLVNIVPIAIFGIGLRYLLRYLCVYMLIRLSKWEFKYIDGSYELIKKIMIIEVILVVWQFVSRETSNVFLYPNYGKILENIGSSINAVSGTYAIYGSLGRYNLFGYFATLAIWLLIAEIEVRESKSVLNLMIWSILLVLSFSRQTIVGIIAAYIVYLYMKKRITKKQVLLICLIGLVVLALVLNAANYMIEEDYTSTGVGVATGGIYDRYISMFSLDFLKIDYEGKGRTWFLTEGMRLLVSSKPVLGYGLGMYGCPDAISLNSSVYTLLKIPTTYYMDVYIGCVIGQIGLLGFYAYMSAYVWVLKKCMACINATEEDIRIKKLAIITFGILLSSLIMMFFSSSMCNRIMALYVWVFIGLFLNIRSKDNNYAIADNIIQKIVNRKV